MKADILQERIYRYVLGDLPEQEESALEQEFLADAELFEQVWEAENELIDRYARGKLTPADKHLFENHYLASPIHRDRLAVARNLVQAADSVAERGDAGFATEPSANWWGSLLAGWNSNRLRWAMAAAVLLLAAGSIWLLTENMRLREQVNQARHQEASEQRIQELEKELNAQREQRDELAAELAALREEQPPTVGTQTQPNQGEQRAVVSFLLSPVLMRSGGEPQDLKIPKDIAAVLLKMIVEEPDGRSFQASLRTVEGTQVWTRGALRARQEKKGLAVSVSIPANKISTSDYILTLSAVNKNNEPEEINRYFFRVIKQ